MNDAVKMAMIDNLRVAARASASSVETCQLMEDAADALEQAVEPVAGIGHGEEADYAELKRLYNFSDDDSGQFTRWNMLAAIRHGKRLGQEFDAGEGVAGEGWVYWNQDSGEEYALNHPVESGECVEAEHVRRSTGMEDHFNAEFQRLTKELAAPSHHPTAEPVGLREAQYLIKSIAEVVEKDGGCWSACSGCQESVDGYVSSRDYPYSQIFKCQPGCGCRECGGIGVVWQDGNFLASYGDALAINQTERVYEPYPGAFDDLIGPEGATTPAEHDGENVLAKLEAIRDVVAAAYYACEDSEDDGDDNIHVMRSSWEQLSASLDAIDAIMPDEVQPALPAVLVTLVMEAFATPSQPGPQSREPSDNQIDAAKAKAMDEAADFCIQTLAKALGVDDWEQADGSETWDGDVAGTIYNVLCIVRSRRCGNGLHGLGLAVLISPEAPRE